MMQTVMVAAITAGAALGGTIVAASLSLRAARLANEYQLIISREERAEQRIAALRQARREAYIAFLDGASSVIEKIAGLRSPQIGDGEFDHRFEDAWEASNRLLPLINLVAVEGPLEVAQCARELRAALYDELRSVRGVRAQGNPGAFPDGPTERRRRAVTRLSQAAREALGSDINTA